MAKPDPLEACPKDLKLRITLYHQQFDGTGFLIYEPQQQKKQMPNTRSIKVRIGYTKIQGERRKNVKTEQHIAG